MKGNIEYSQRYEKLIENLLKNYPNLNGFYYFINTMRIATIYSYLLDVSKFLESTNKQPSDLILDDFTKYMVDIKVRMDTGAPTSSSYRIAVYSAIKKYGKYLVASRQLDMNPMDYVSRPKAIESQETIQKREIGFLDKEETGRYLRTIRLGAGSERSKKRQKEWKDRDMAIILLFLNTGIRNSALMRIDVEDIDFKSQTVTVTDKGSKVKTYDLSDNVIAALESWMYKRNQLLNGNKIVSALFISNRRKRLSQDGISKIVNKYACNIPRKHITPHKLRATFGTQLYDATHDIYFVQENMGHQNPKTTELYIRGTDNTKRRQASDIMGKFINQ